jgi:aconitate hydratase
MGLLPLEFPTGESAGSLGLTGREVFDITGVAGVKPGGTLPVVARRDDGTEIRFPARVRIDTPTELHYYRQGGILPTVLRKVLSSA